MTRPASTSEYPCASSGITTGPGPGAPCESARPPASESSITPVACGASAWITVALKLSTCSRVGFGRPAFACAAVSASRWSIAATAKIPRVPESASSRR